MTKIIIKRALLFLGLFLFSVSASAADLTDKQVKNYIASIKAFDQMDDSDFESILEDENEEMDLSSLEDGMPSMAKILADAPKDDSYKAAESVVKKNGFANMNEWAQVADKVNAAIMATMLEDESGNAAEEMAQMRAELEQMEGMSEEQKQAMLSLADSSMQMVEGMTEDVSEEDKAVIKRNFDELDSVLDLED